MLGVIAKKLKIKTVAGKVMRVITSHQPRRPHLMIITLISTS
jgi:hypothetical protein